MEDSTDYGKSPIKTGIDAVKQSKSDADPDKQIAELESYLKGRGFDTSKAIAPVATKTAPQEETEASLEKYLTERKAPGYEPKTTISGVAGSIAHGAALGAPGLVLPAADLAVSSINKMFGTHYTNASDAITHLLKDQGIPEPRTATERIIKEATEAGVGAFTGSTEFSLLSKLPSIAKWPKIAKALEFLGESPLRQTAAGITGGAAQQAVKEAGFESPFATIPAAIGGSMIGFGLSGIGKPIAAAVASKKPLTDIAKVGLKAAKEEGPAREALAAAAAPSAESLAAAKGSGLQQVLPPEYLGASPEYQALSRVGAEIPESVVASKQIKAQQALADKSKSVLSELGATEDLSTLSDNLKESMQLNHSSIKQAEGDAWDVISSGISPKTQTPTVSLENKFNKEMQGIKNPKEKGSLFVEINKFLKKKIATYAEADALRERIGAQLAREATVFPDASYKHLSEFYGALADDLKQTAIKKGLKNEADIARELTILRKGYEDSIVSLFGDQVEKSLSPKLKQAGEALTKGDADTMRNLMENVPAEYKQTVAATSLQRLFGDSLESGAMDIPGFVESFGKLKSQKAAYNALLDNIPASAKKQIESFYAISKNINQVAQSQKDDKAIRQVFDAATPLMNKIVSVVGSKLPYSDRKAMNAALSGIETTPEIDKLLDLMASKEFAELVAVQPKGVDAKAKAAKALMGSSAWSRFKRLMSETTGGWRKISAIESAIMPTQSEE